MSAMWSPCSGRGCTTRLVTEVDERETAATRALEALGYGEWKTAVPPLETIDATVRAYALSQLLIRAAGLHARRIEASMTGTWRQDHITAAACIATAVPDDDGQHERAFWEVQRVATLLDHLDIGVQGDPYLAAAAAATSAATTLLFAPSRRPDDLEAVIDGWGRHITAQHLDQARNALQTAPDAVDVARDRLGPDDLDG